MGPRFFLGLFVLYWAGALAADSLGGGLAAQGLIGAATWLFLAAALRAAPRALRLPTLTMVAIASAGEGLGSLLWGAYQYRYHNLPLYVPPGHGLFYLAALWLTQLPRVRGHGRALVALTAVASAGGALHGLLAEAPPDVVGTLCWLLFAGFLWRGRDPLLFALTFGLTMGLEYYGTALGTWHWLATQPLTGLPAGNPPAAIGVGYCVLDALTLRVAGRITTWLPALGARPGRAGPAGAGE